MIPNLHYKDSLKAFGEKTADIFKKEDHSNQPTEEEQKQTVVEAIVEKQQKVAKEEDILSHKDQGEDSWNIYNPELINNHFLYLQMHSRRSTETHRTKCTRSLCSSSRS